MGDLAQRTILKLQEGVSGEELGHYCRIASDFIIKAQHLKYISGFNDTDSESVTQEERERLLNALTSLLSCQQNTEDTLQIIFALGKSEEQKYIHIYRELLQKTIDETRAQSSLLFQLLIALENANVAVFERDTDGSTSQNVLDIEKNVRQAERFLQQPRPRRRKKE